MKLLERIFRKPNNVKTAQTAKERLQIIVAHQRSGRHLNQRNEPEFMEEMKREILKVVRKYVDIQPQDIEANISKEGEMDVLAQHQSQRAHPSDTASQ